MCCHGNHILAKTLWVELLPVFILLDDNNYVHTCDWRFSILTVWCILLNSPSIKTGSTRVWPLDSIESYPDDSCVWASCTIPSFIASPGWIPWLFDESSSVASGSLSRTTQLSNFALLSLVYLPFDHDVLFVTQLWYLHHAATCQEGPSCWRSILCLQGNLIGDET